MSRANYAITVDALKESLKDTFLMFVSLLVAVFVPVL